MTRNQQLSLRTQSLFLFIFCLIVVAAYGLIALLQLFPQPPAPDLSILNEPYQFFVSPKPIERNIFLLLGLTVPICTLFLARNLGLFHKAAYSKLVLIVLPFIIFVLLFAPLRHSDFINLVIPQTTRLNSDLILFLCFVIAGVWCLWVAYSKFTVTKPQLIRNSVWVIVLSAMLLLTLAWRIVGINTVTQDAAWYTHVDAAIYSTTQVVAGKTLLVDLPSQYGLFPELIAPLLRATKATLLNFSLLFAILQTISLLGLFFVLSKLTKSSMLMLVGSISLLVMTFQTIIYFIGIYDRYFQYWPIRFFWPALSVFAFYWFAANKTLWRTSLMSAIGAIGTFWVIDTGLFISLSFAAYLAARLVIELVLSRDEKKPGHYKFYLVALSLHLILTGLLLAIFLGALWLKAQQPLHLSWLVQYQKIFYGLGFTMLPLPQAIHPWMSILGIYLFGIIIGLVAFYQRTASIRADLIFYLSLLGLGLFIYYEGRAHVFILIIVSWPALMIMISTTDSTLNQIRSKTLALTEIWLPIATLSFLLACCFHFILNVPRMCAEVKAVFATRNISNAPVVISELAFIKHHSQAKQKCLILSKRQAIYYAESGLGSPINGPGLIETILKSDSQQLLNSLVSGHISCIFLGVGESAPTDPNLMATIKEKYKLVAQNAEHTMLYLIPA